MEPFSPWGLPYSVAHSVTVKDCQGNAVRGRRATAIRYVLLEYVKSNETALLGDIWSTLLDTRGRRLRIVGLLHHVKRDYLIGAVWSTLLGRRGRRTSTVGLLYLNRTSGLAVLPAPLHVVHHMARQPPTYCKWPKLTYTSFENEYAVMPQHITPVVRGYGGATQEGKGHAKHPMRDTRPKYK